MRRPQLNEIPLEGARAGGNYIMVGENEWDTEIENAYDKGFVLIQFGSNELAVKAYRRVMDSQIDLFSARSCSKQGE